MIGHTSSFMVTTLRVQISRACIENPLDYKCEANYNAHCCLWMPIYKRHCQDDNWYFYPMVTPLYSGRLIGPDKLSSYQTLQVQVEAGQFTIRQH